MENTLNIMLVDDDLISGAITSNVLKIMLGSHNLKIFLNVDDGLQYINQIILNKNHLDIIFIDLNFTGQILQGWDLLHQYENKYKNILSEDTKVYVLSSSVDKNDIDRAKKYSFVRGFIYKPLAKENLSKIL